MSKKVVRVTIDDLTATYKETEVKGSTHVMTNDNEALRVKALRAGETVADLVDSALDKAAGLVKTKADELVKSGALELGYAAAKGDSADIGRLGPLVTELAATFEDMMTVIQNHQYEQQVKLLTGYKKLIEEQINVVDSRIHFVRRVRSLP
ncbi:MAG TPA: hypothetical protein VNI77_00545 [Nitrososphaera sp.]|nr:hypothetical protein [Nitrososphaera sp.]